MTRLVILTLFIFIPLARGYEKTTTYRVYHKHKRPISFTNDQGDLVNMPSGTRLVKGAVEGYYYTYYPPFKRYERLKLIVTENIKLDEWPLDKENFKKGMNNCKKLSRVKQVFMNEAEEALHFSEMIKRRQYRRYYKEFKDTYPDMAKQYMNSEKAFSENFPDFYKLIIKIKKSLAKLRLKKFSSKKLNKYLKFISKELPTHKLVARYRDILKKSFNPKATHRADAKKFSETSFYALFNFDFLTTNYNEWYNKHWRYNTINPLRGNSGEGFNAESLGDNQSDWYKLKRQLFKLKKSISPRHFKYVSNVNKKKFKNNERLIFIHNKVFQDRMYGAWRDYIPVDQSTSCFISDALFSTIIHESNVNAGKYTYFPEDTHAYPVEITYGNFLKYRNENFHKFKSIIAREPHLHLIYLDFILNNF